MTFTFTFRVTLLDKGLETGEMTIATEFLRVPFRAKKVWRTLLEKSRN